MNRQERLADFAERVKSDPSSVRDAAEIGRYILVNPLADESTLLQKLEIDSSSCVKVDLYWEYKSDIIFVQIQCATYTSDRSPGIYGRKAYSGGMNFVVVVPDETITSDTVYSSLKRLAAIEIREADLTDHLQELKASRPLDR